MATFDTQKLFKLDRDELKRFALELYHQSLISAAQKFVDENRNNDDLSKKQAQSQLYDRMREDAHSTAMALVAAIEDLVINQDTVPASSVVVTSINYNNDQLHSVGVKFEKTAVTTTSAAATTPPTQQAVETPQVPQPLREGAAVVPVEADLAQYQTQIEQMTSGAVPTEIDVEFD